MIRRGGYVLIDSQGEPAVIIIATGSEVALAMQARLQLADQGQRVRVVSMPCQEQFDAQDLGYRHSVLPPTVTARISIEAGVTNGWCRYTGDRGITLGVDQFGASAPYQEVFDRFGLNAQSVADTVRGLLATPG